MRSLRAKIFINILTISTIFSIVILSGLFYNFDQKGYRYNFYYSEIKNKFNEDRLPFSTNTYIGTFKFIKLRDIFAQDNGLLNIIVEFELLDLTKRIHSGHIHMRSQFLYSSEDMSIFAKRYEVVDIELFKGKIPAFASTKTINHSIKRIKNLALFRSYLFRLDGYFERLFFRKFLKEIEIRQKSIQLKF